MRKPTAHYCEICERKCVCEEEHGCVGHPNCRRMYVDSLYLWGDEIAEAETGPILIDEEDISWMEYMNYESN